MAHKRVLLPAPRAADDLFYAQLACLGFAYTANLETRITEINIEDALLWLSQLAMDQGQARELGTLVAWFGAHYPYVNMGRLADCLTEGNYSERVKALWSAMGHWKQNDPRLAKLRNVYTGPVIPWSVHSVNYLQMRGADPRFEGSPFEVAAGTIRTKASDQTPVNQIAARHNAYRWRVIIGPVYRADLWAMLEQDASLTPAELARRAYVSYPAALEAHHDYLALRPSLDQTSAKAA